MWIVRNKEYKELRVFGGKPRRKNGYFLGDDLYGHTKTSGFVYPDNEGIFKDITFENSPVEVEIKLKTK